MLVRPSRDTVGRIVSCDLRLGNRTWLYAEQNADAIDRNWTAALENNPNYFNGIIHLIDVMESSDHHVGARLLRTDFKSYLFWRMNGWQEAGVLDGFGSALLRSSEGDILLGRQRPGHVNAGLTYLPGGFIDARDVRDDGSVDLAGSITRELAEETGLGAGELKTETGYFLTQTGPHVSFAAPITSALSTHDLKERIEDHIRAGAAPELAGIVVIKQLCDLDGLAMAHYARVLVTALLSAV